MRGRRGVGIVILLSWGGGLVGLAGESWGWGCCVYVGFERTERFWSQIKYVFSGEARCIDCVKHVQAELNE